MRPSSPARRPRWCPSARSTTASSASPARSPVPSRRRTSPRSGARSTATRTGWSMSDSAGVDVVLPESVEVFDTTLRDGSQLEGISLTVDDKLRIAEQLDWLGVDYIEGGWPAANPKDAEHFFDGYKRNPEFSLRVLEGAVEKGASTLVLCDTNGGSLPHEVERIVADAVRYFGNDVRIGVHTHDDTGCGVANALVGVRGGATHVQGTVNGYGERTGNCNLTTVIANLALKMGVRTIPADRMERLTPVSHHVAELVNMPLNPQQPYVGTSAFAHKAGLHVSAIVRRPDAYEHVP